MNNKKKKKKENEEEEEEDARLTEFDCPSKLYQIIIIILSVTLFLSYYQSSNSEIQF